MRDQLRAWACALAAVGGPVAALWTGGGESVAFAVAGLTLAACGRAPLWLLALAALPLFQLLPGDAPPELAEAMAAAGVTGPGTLAADPAALWIELRALTGCLTAFALARSAAGSSQRAACGAVAAVALFGCFEGALGVASGVGATPPSGTLVNRGQYGALLELTFGAGCGLAAACWAGRSWRERLEEKALAGALLGLTAAGLSLAGIAASLSRTGIVAGGLAAIAAALWFGRRNVWALAAVGALLVGLAVESPRAIHRFEALAEGGDPGRQAIWRDSLELARAHWVAGVGFGSFPSAFRRSAFYLPRKSIENAHSDYLELFVELGAPVAITLLIALALALWRPAGSGLAAGCLLGVGAVLLHALVDLPLQLPALAALLAALLGFAGRRGSSSRYGAVALGLLTVAAALAPIKTPEQSYVAAGEASARGETAKAETLYREALDRNLHTAPAWLRLAELERGRGRQDCALLFTRAARTVEPYTLRTEWPLAELELAAGEAESGLQRLAGLVAAAPDLLDAALHTASRSGLSPTALEALVPPDDPEAAGRYLAFLVRNQASDRLPGAYARLGAPSLPQPYRDWLAREAGFHP